MLRGVKTLNLPNLPSPLPFTANSWLARKWSSPQATQLTKQILRFLAAFSKQFLNHFAANCTYSRGFNR